MFNFFKKKKRELPSYIDKIEDLDYLQIVRAKGDMDQSVIPIIEKRIQENRKAGDTKMSNILLDFRLVGKVDTAAIAFHLLRLKEHQAENYTIAFINISDEHRTLLEMLKQEHEFVIYGSEEEAVKSLNKQ